MSSRTTTVLGRVRPVVDEKTIDRSAGGHQIDWANVSSAYLQTDGKKFIPAWTCIGLTLGAGKMSPRVVTTNPAEGFIESDAKEGDLSAALSGYGVVFGGYLWENLLPDSSGGPPRVLAAGIKSELVTAGNRFKFFQYTDSR